jgi:CSLREA domain-containing protein
MSLEAPAVKLAVLGAALLLRFGSPGMAGAATITVNTQDDELNADGDCSLREALRAANMDAAVDGCVAGNGADVIVLPAGTYNLTVAGPFEDQGLTGDLDIFSDVAIHGSGSPTTRINAVSDRVFDVRPGANATLARLTIAGGSIDDSGGGVRNGGTLVVTQGTIRDNDAFGDGGGIYNTGKLRVSRSTIAGNLAFNSGAGIGNAGELQVVNSTVSHNRVIDPFMANRGGGLRNTGISADLLNVTINRNETAPGGTGGGIVNDGGTVRVKNVIVANSPAHANCGGLLTSAGHNIDSGNTCGFTDPGDLSGTDPRLGPLANNGGPTATHALLAGSPAIDAGANGPCPGTDQRGIPRPQDGDGDGTVVCDMGAYEKES